MTPFHEEFLSRVPADLWSRSGEVFYSGRSAFATEAPLYILGLNPGGDPSRQATETVRASVEAARSRSVDIWSSYADASWNGRPPGTAKMQPRVRHLMTGLGLDIRETPASNVVFVRAAREAHLKAEKAALLRSCWPVHEAVIDRLCVGVVVCLGRTAGAWVRSMVGANDLVEWWSETNRRRWTSRTHASANGLQVVTLTHPSVADWTSSNADPAGLVASALERAQVSRGSRQSAASGVIAA